MKTFPPHTLTFVGLSLLLSTALSLAPHAGAAPSAKPTNEVVQLEPLRSEFTIPVSVNDGCDPFFPKSTRLAATEPDKPERGAVVLTLKAISGTADHPLALINDRTLAVGETSQVRTAQGRVQITLLAISGLKAVVQIGSETRELSMRGNSLTSTDH